MSPGRGLALLSARGLTQVRPRPSRDPPPPKDSLVTTRSTVVVLHAHPDDEAIFTGATIRALADDGVASRPDHRHRRRGGHPPRPAAAGRDPARAPDRRTGTCLRAARRPAPGAAGLPRLRGARRALPRRHRSAGRRPSTVARRVERSWPASGAMPWSTTTRAASTDTSTTSRCTARERASSGVWGSPATRPRWTPPGCAGARGTCCSRRPASGSTPGWIRPGSA